MILPQMAQSVGFGVFWVRTAVLGVPKSLIEAGRLDGASEWSLLYRVIVPSIYPAIKTMSALVFLWTWNSFLLPLVMLSTPSLYVVTIGLETFQGAHFSNYAALAAASVIAALPVLIVYLFAQRSFISGMFAGAVVE
jgi:raffinose/stachyose/melibiose transport system permease protein